MSASNGWNLSVCDTQICKVVIILPMETQGILASLAVCPPNRGGTRICMMGGLGSLSGGLYGGYLSGQLNIILWQKFSDWHKICSKWEGYSPYPQRSDPGKAPAP